MKGLRKHVLWCMLRGNYSSRWPWICSFATYLSYLGGHIENINELIYVVLFYFSLTLKCPTYSEVALSSSSFFLLIGKFEWLCSLSTSLSLKELVKVETGKPVAWADIISALCTDIPLQYANHWSLSTEVWDHETKECTLCPFLQEPVFPSLVSFHQESKRDPRDNFNLCLPNSLFPVLFFFHFAFGKTFST